jgi:dienelactone hydrolase
MRISRTILSALLFTSCGPLLAQQDAATPIPAGSHYVEREFRLPAPNSAPAGLDALEVYVTTPGKHPLVLLTHGTSAKMEERMQVTPWAQLPQALWFARRGYVALVVVRRGYGNSGGEQDGAHGGCRTGGSFAEAGEASAVDLRNAAAYAAKELPEVDASTVISAGVSTGGFAQVALTADPPPGLKVAISFAGGRGGDGAGHLCNEGDLESAFKSFGKHSHTPMLWIYADNDKWFPPPFAAKFEEAFEKAGGTDEFIHAPADGDDGHHLFAHVAAWSPTVDKFLGDHQLLPLAAPYPLPTPPDVDPPPGLHGRGLEGFKSYLILGPNKAFATNGQGFYGFAVGQFTQALADQHALENCNKARHDGPACSVVLRGNGK